MLNIASACFVSQADSSKRYIIYNLDSIKKNSLKFPKLETLAIFVMLNQTRNETESEISNSLYAGSDRVPAITKRKGKRQNSL